MQLRGFVVVTAAMRQAQVRQVGGWLRNGTLPDSLQTTCRLQQLAWAAVERMMMGLGLFAGTDKVIMDPGAIRAVVPYQPLDQLGRRPQSAPQTGGGR